MMMVDGVVDAISLAVFRSLFASVAEEMGVTLQRASFSPNIKERLDFSCALFDGRARMVAQAAHIPVHLGSMPASVAHALRAFEVFRPGDVIILNDPYHGGTHLPDVTMVSPVFVDERGNGFPSGLSSVPALGRATTEGRPDGRTQHVGAGLRACPVEGRPDGRTQHVGAGLCACPAVGRPDGRTQHVGAGLCACPAEGRPDERTQHVGAGLCACPVEGRPDFFVASRAHHADVGGMTPGSLPLSTELYQEGIIIPPVKLVDAGRRNEGILALITANSRAPEERLGDLEAQLAAHRVGERRLRALVDAHGKARVQEHAEALMDYSRRMTEAAIARIPGGAYSFEDALEGDGQRQYRIPMRVKVTVAGSRMTVDFAGSAPQVLGNLNAVEPVARSATWYCIRLLAEEDVPVNHGCFQPVAVVTPAHSLLAPDFPAAVAVGNMETSQRIVDAVLGALAQALPDRIPAASQGTMNNLAFGGVVHGRSFVYYETIGGGHGGGPLGGGLSGRHSHMTNTRNTPVEALEYRLPVRVVEYALREGSGGKGRHRGGDGVRRTFAFLAPATITINSERRVHGPYGLQGGQPGQVGVNRIVRGDVETVVGAKATVQVQAGDRVVIETPGGGGWGPPRALAIQKWAWRGILVI